MKNKGIFERTKKSLGANPSRERRSSNAKVRGGKHSKKGLTSVIKEKIEKSKKIKYYREMEEKNSIWANY